MADPSNVFSNAIRETLRIWPVLTLARQQGFGGRNAGSKEEWLCDSVLQIFKDNELVYPDELEDFLAEAVFNEFDTIIEDGSTKEISSRLCLYYDMCRTSQTAALVEEVKKLQAIQPSVTAQRAPNQDNNEDDSDDSGNEEHSSASRTGEPSESMDVDQPGEGGSSSSKDTAPKVDADGWEVVRKKR